MMDLIDISSLSNEHLLVAGALLASAVFMLWLVARAFFGGLLEAGRVFWGRRPAHVFSGTLELIGRVARDHPRYFFHNLRFRSNDGGTVFTCGRMRVGADIYASGILAAGWRGQWLVRHGRFKNNLVKKAWLIGFTDGSDIYYSARDMADMHGFTTVYAMVLAIVAAVLVLIAQNIDPVRAQLPALLLDYPWWAPPLASLLIVLIFVSLIYRLAAKAMAAQHLAQLQMMALEVAAAGSQDEDGHLARPAAPPVEYDEDASQAIGIIGWVMPVALLLIPLVRLFEAFLVMGLAFSRPHFELWPMTIAGRSKPRRNLSGQIEYSDLVLRDKGSDINQRANWVKVSEILLNNGLIRAGSSGLWLISRKSPPPGRDPGDSRIKKLVLAGYYDESWGLIYDRAELLNSYGYKPATPLMAALFGLALGLVFLIGLTDSIRPWPEVLLLIPAVVGPYLTVIAARNKIVSAAETIIKQRFSSRALTRI